MNEWQGDQHVKRDESGKIFFLGHTGWGDLFKILGIAILWLGAWAFALLIFLVTFAIAISPAPG